MVLQWHREVLAWQAGLGYRALRARHAPKPARSAHALDTSCNRTRSFLCGPLRRSIVMGGNGIARAAREPLCITHHRREQCACRAYGGGEEGWHEIAPARPHAAHVQSQRCVGTVAPRRPGPIRRGPAKSRAAGVITVAQLCASHPENVSCSWRTARTCCHRITKLRNHSTARHSWLRASEGVMARV